MVIDISALVIPVVPKSSKIINTTRAAQTECRSTSTGLSMSAIFLLLFFSNIRFWTSQFKKHMKNVIHSIVCVFYILIIIVMLLTCALQQPKLCLKVLFLVYSGSRTNSRLNECYRLLPVKLIRYTTAQKFREVMVYAR